MTIKSDVKAIPEKLYFTIGEVASLCGLQPHVLRYWEQEFQQLSPSKRRGNRRYYQRKDVILIRKIKDLLYNQRFSIEGARRQLLGEPADSAKIEKKKTAIKQAVDSLENVLGGLDGVENSS